MLAGLDEAHALRAELRRLGYGDLVPVRPKRDARGEGRKRCQWQGGYCMKYVTGSYCPEHEHAPIGSAYKGR